MSAMKTEIRSDASAVNWSPAGQLEVLTFDLQGEVFALEAIRVREILDVAVETVVPGAPALVGGVINFRGKVIPLADLRLAFGLETKGDTIDSRIIVIEMDIEGEPTLVGLRTDKVHEVTTLAQASSEAPPSIGMRWRAEFIQGLVKRSGEFIVLPDLAAIFSSLRDTPAAGGAAALHRH
jgi:purine-binding chemotaxis protein CheW